MASCVNCERTANDRNYGGTCWELPLKTIVVVAGGVSVGGNAPNAVKAPQGDVLAPALFAFC